MRRRQEAPGRAFVLARCATAAALSLPLAARLCLTDRTAADA
jgi:hypothetical protein